MCKHACVCDQYLRKHLPILLGSAGTGWREGWREEGGRGRRKTRLEGHGRARGACVGGSRLAGEGNTLEELVSVAAVQALMKGEGFALTPACQGSRSRIDPSLFSYMKDFIRFTSAVVM